MNDNSSWKSTRLSDYNDCKPLDSGWKKLSKSFLNIDIPIGTTILGPLAPSYSKLM